MEKYPRTRARRRALAPVVVAAAPPAPVLETRPAVASPPATQDALCSYAETFAAFARSILAAVENATQSVHVNRAKVLLTDQYFRLRRTLPVEHQDRIATDGHPCVYGVFVATYEALERKELEIVPIAFELPVAARPPSRKKQDPPPDPMNPETIHRLIMGDGGV